MSDKLKHSFFDYSVQDANESKYDLAKHKGKIVLVVNVASKCGFTGQYTGLEELYKEFGGEKFLILGFPCNQFGSQESGTNDQIQQFCSLTYNVTFPVLAKIDVNGDDTAPVYQFLKHEARGILGTERIKWNFTKFLVGKNGQVLKRYAPTTEPKDIIADIKAALA